MSRYYLRMFIFLLMAVILLLTACGGETNQDVISKYQSQYKDLRVKLQKVAQALPETASEQVASNLNPPPKYVERAKEALNTDIVMYEQLLDPDVELRENNQLDLILSNALVTGLRWTGDHNPMLASSLKQSAADTTTAILEQGLHLKYLGVARVTEYQPAVATDPQTFTGGLAKIDGFLVDLDSQAVVCSFGISASPEAQVPYQYKENESQTQKLTEAAYSSLWRNSRQAFIASFNKLCGGEFALLKSDTASSDTGGVSQAGKSAAAVPTPAGDTGGDTPANTAATATALPTGTDSAEAYFKAGLDLLDTEKYQEAIAEFDRAIALDPNLAAAYLKRGFAYGNLGQDKQALADFEKALELEPDNSNNGEVYFNLALAYFKTRQDEKAVEFWGKAIAAGQDSAEAYLNRGKSYFNLKQYKEAITDCTQAIELDAQLAEAYNLRGKANAYLNNFEQAIPDLSQAIELDPKLTEAYFNRAVCRNKITKGEDYAAIIADFAIVLKLNDKPDMSQQAQQALENAYKNLTDPALRQQAAEALGLEAAEPASAGGSNSPEAVVQAIFDAAKTQDFATLPGLCDPLGQNDEDTALICAITAQHPQKDAFVQIFAPGKISGKAIVKDNQAQVPFLFGPAGDKEETMDLILRDGQWYLLGF